MEASTTIYIPNTLNTAHFVNGCDANMNSNEHAIAYASARGWQVVEVTDAGIQFSKPREINILPAAGLFLISIVFWLASVPYWVPLIGIVAAIFVSISTALRAREHKVFLTSSDIARKDFTEL